VSLIAGIARLDGAPVAAMGSTGAAALTRMAARAGVRAPHPTIAACGEHAACLHEDRPLIEEGLSIVFDGRLDNRDDLARELAVDRNADDDALVLFAYRKWATAAVEHLLGDFAFAIWDAPRRQLYAARDVAGVRPFLYREGRGWLAWASEVDLLAACVDTLPAPNEGMAGEYLTGVITSRRDTLFEGIYRLPPAHALTASSHWVRTRCYWTPEPRTGIVYRTDGDYEAHLRDLLRASVSDRLRTTQAAGVMLSGGIDSSAVTVVGAHACRTATVPCPELRAYSVHDPQADEREHFEMLSRIADVRCEVVSSALPRPGQFRDETARDLDVQTFPQSPTLDRLRARVRRDGARVLLTGVGSDDWLGTSPLSLADLLRRGRIAALWRRMWRESKDDDFDGWPFTLKSVVWPLVPAPAKGIVRRIARRGRLPAWIRPEFAERIHLRERLACALAVDVEFPTYEQAHIWQSGRNGLRIHGVEATTRAGRRFGIDHAHPFLDRRVMEFGLALPADQRWRGGRPKDLLRRAMAADVPAAIAGRLTSPSGGHVVMQALDAELHGRELTASACEQRGWICASQLAALHARAHALYQSGNPSYTWPAWNAWSAVAMNLWLDAVTVVQ